MVVKIIDSFEEGTSFEELVSSSVLSADILHPSINESDFLNSLAEETTETSSYFENPIFVFMEAFICLCGLIVLSPLLLLIAILVATQGKGPILYSQLRLGKNEKPFKIFKFRSMHIDAEKSGPFICTNYNDSRITKLGSFLRRSKLDELPQLFNVVKGDMSLVGPRPEREFFHDKNQWIKNWNKRLDYRPGITGLAQISKYISHNPEHKIYADLYYAKNRTLVSDLKLIIFTILPFLKKDKFFGMKMR